MGESVLPMRRMVGDVPPVTIRKPPEQEVDFLGAGDQRAKLRDAVRRLTQIFPDICPEAASAHLGLLSELQPVEQALQSTVNMFLEKRFPRSITVPGNMASTSNSAPNPDKRFPRSITFKGNMASTSNSAANPDGRRLGTRNYEVFVDLHSSSGSVTDANYPRKRARKATDGDCYQEWCISKLSEDFPRVPMKSMRAALSAFRGELIPTYKSVNLQFSREARKTCLDCTRVEFLGDQGPEDSSWLSKGKLELLKGYRWQSRPRPEIKCPRFERDLKALLSEERVVVEFDKVSVNNVEAVRRQEEALIECGCCCSETPFEELVQCADGHLFCKACLRRHLEGYMFGVSQTCGLPLCMDTNGCERTFPWSEVRRSLPLDVLSKYEQRQAEDSVARAKLEGLVYCPFCNHPWEVDPGMCVLNCRKQTCKKSSCIKCKEPSHLPLRCEQVEKKSETAARKKVEERMTKALIRECISCRAELIKHDGCNKLTCRCGQIMCHVCRQSITNYKHFCQHTLQPGKPCTKCSGCSLWATENAVEVVKAAKAEAIKDAGTHDPALLKLKIGPSDAAGTPQNAKIIARS